MPDPFGGIGPWGFAGLTENLACLGFLKMQKLRQRAEFAVLGNFRGLESSPRPDRLAAGPVRSAPHAAALAGSLLWGRAAYSWIWIRALTTPSR